MSALARLLYPAPVLSRSPLAVIGWWERRRWGFNLVVGLTGLVTLMTVNLVTWLPPDGHRLFFPPLAILAYAVLANICYTAGWFFELLFNAWWGQGAPKVGPVLFRQGIIFSVGLTLLPIGLAAITWTFRLLRAVF